MALQDSRGRTIDYLRIGLIDRCNLRCSYCMPHDGLDWIPHDQLLNDEEIVRLLRISSSLGIRKVRFTGGEPLMRKNALHLFRLISEENLFEKWSITTNGVTTHRYLKELRELGLHGINLSLDTLDRERFKTITRRDHLEDVLKTFHKALEIGLKVKVNMVVQQDINTQDIPSMAKLALEYPADIRFIEEMPFNGGERKLEERWDAVKVLAALKTCYPDLAPCKQELGETAQNYASPALKGTLGIIAAWTRSFCGSCNRLRITPDGKLKTCLYESGGVSLRDHMRQNKTDEEIAQIIRQAVHHKFVDGHEAERISGLNHDSMATIGG
jgi:molybdenum cofactor biosynthesis protein A